MIQDGINPRKAGIKTGINNPTTMKELIEKYKKQIAFSEGRLKIIKEESESDRVWRKHHSTVIERLTNVISDLESLQSKGKTKESAVDYLVKEFSEILGSIMIQPMQDLLMEDAIQKAKAMEEYALSRANKDGVVVAEKRTDIECPECGEHHVDKDEWSKRLHKKHLCEKCGHVWQPHEGYTFGI